MTKITTKEELRKLRDRVKGEILLRSGNTNLSIIISAKSREKVKELFNAVAKVLEEKNFYNAKIETEELPDLEAETKITIKTNEEKFDYVNISPAETSKTIRMYLEKSERGGK